MIYRLYCPKISDFIITSLYYRFYVQSGEWLKLKILDLQPELTKLGASVKEATELLNDHDQVLLRLQVMLNVSKFFEF